MAIRPLRAVSIAASAVSLALACGGDDFAGGNTPGATSGTAGMNTGGLGGRASTGAGGEMDAAAGASTSTTATAGGSSSTAAAGGSAGTGVGGRASGGAGAGGTGGGTGGTRGGAGGAGGAGGVCPPCAAPPNPSCHGQGPCGCGPYVCPDAGDDAGDAAPLCGNVRCPPGKVCCNPLMSLCTDPGGVCLQ
jgi:hypothetical protein